MLFSLEGQGLSRKNHEALESATMAEVVCWERLWYHWKVTVSYQCCQCTLCFKNSISKLVMKPWNLGPEELRVLCEMIHTQVIIVQSNCKSNFWFGLDWWNTAICL